MKMKKSRLVPAKRKRPRSRRAAGSLRDHLRTNKMRKETRENRRMTARERNQKEDQENNDFISDFTSNSIQIIKILSYNTCSKMLLFKIKQDKVNSNFLEILTSI
jgi:hypothetical protein